MTATGAILCGGKSTRMGQDKASLRLSGRPMVDWVARSMKEAGVESIVALGGDSSIALPIIPDELEQQGPLHVLINAVERLGDILVCPCDAPLVSARLFRSLLAAGAESEEAVALAESDQLQPLIGLYKKSSAGLLRSGLDRGARGPKMVLKEGDFVVVRATSEETQNINTPEQFDALIAALSSNKARS